MKKQLIKLLSALLLTLAVLSTTALNTLTDLSPNTETHVDLDKEIIKG